MKFTVPDFEGVAKSSGRRTGPAKGSKTLNESA
jgi:hypothetical protein